MDREISFERRNTMSTIHYPPEIVSAKDKLKRFDLTDRYEKLEYVKEFYEGIQSINDYILNNPNSPFLEKLISLKRAYSRVFLFWVKWINMENINIQADSFYFIFELIRYKLEDEVKYIIGNYPELSSVIQEFFQAKSHILNHLIAEFERLQKQTNNKG